MRKILLFIISVIVFQGVGQAQLSESFTDGDFTSNPTWTGDVSLFKVNTAFQLQLNATTETPAILAVPIVTSTEMEWKWNVCCGELNNYDLTN